MLETNSHEFNNKFPYFDRLSIYLLVFTNFYSTFFQKSMKIYLELKAKIFQTAPIF